MKEKYFIFTVVFIFVLLAVPLVNAFAADDLKPIEDRSAQDVVSGMGNKAARGVANVATGWMELPKQIYVTAREDGTAKGIFIGPLKGIGMTLVRTLAGVGELVTFFVPYPGFYDPYVEPSYVWEKE